jgi:hypothetical protein
MNLRIFSDVQINQTLVRTPSIEIKNSESLQEIREGASLAFPEARGERHLGKH